MIGANRESGLSYIVEGMEDRCTQSHANYEDGVTEKPTGHEVFEAPADMSQKAVIDRGETP
ncbi:hypothetical protein [Pseudenhygromyxa sp. WMMC2535]|uniref:hypothetical protein n=1 Tax=Pseudenhygromyxa sp. WMMC2535 TaxID=2712867 RepID=UPI001C3DB838|nr:hypothetical protein [Pseudenhygromyxa sp. WMMC2535]